MKVPIYSCCRTVNDLPNCGARLKNMNLQQQTLFLDNIIWKKWINWSQTIELLNYYAKSWLIQIIEKFHLVENLLIHEAKNFLSLRLHSLLKISIHPRVREHPVQSQEIRSHLVVRRRHEGLVQQRLIIKTLFRARDLDPSL